jgi:hypothetical protein
MRIKCIKKFSFVVTFVITFFSAKAQTIDDIIRDPSNNYFIIQQKAKDYFNRVGKVGTGWKEFNRWDFLYRNNIPADGVLPDLVKNNADALTTFRTSTPPTPLAGLANWTPLGQPNPTIEPGDGQSGVGSIRCLEFTGSNLWVGTAGGGMWYGSFLGGSTYSWSAKTDGIPNLAVQDVEICASNTNIIYALTGAVGSASGYRSTGVLKSTDAGNSWATTGLTFPESGGVKGYKILTHPTNSNIVWAATDNGLFRTIDGGTIWNLVTYSTTIGGSQFDLNTNAYDIVFQPGSTATMYATSTGPYFYKSTDGGATFLRVDRAAAGLPATGGNRLQIGVTVANSAYVYLLYGTGSGYQALYLSTNSGSNFTLQSTTPNILGGQSWRNITIAVSPTNAADVYVGGLDVFKSTTSGTTWTQISNWASTSTSNFAHADIFDLYCDATYLYCASDGGLYRMTRSTDAWTNLHSNMQIAQAYRIGIDPTASAAFVTMGNQDNGTYRNTGAQYLSIGGGDGMETVVKPSNTNVIYLSSQSGDFYRSDDGGSTNVFIRSGSGNWTTPAVLRPGFDTHIYIGYVNIDYNSTSGAGAWSTITTSFGSSIESLEFAPNNNTILYATDGSVVRRFNLSAGVWSNTLITGTLPALSNITELTVDPTDANHVLLSVGGYTATQKVYETFNANVASPTWNAIHRNLPNVPVNCIVMDGDVANTIYIGTDIGVFVTNDNRVNWIMYNNGLPTTRVYDLEINTALATDRIYAGTFGRGVFYADTYTGCTTTANLTGTVTGLQYSEVSNTISSNQIIVANAGTSIAYNAGSSITLSDGFRAPIGVQKFQAYIQGCTGAGTPPIPLRTTNATTTKVVEQNAEGDVQRSNGNKLIIKANTSAQSINNKPEGDVPASLNKPRQSNNIQPKPEKPDGTK